jgi:hypothetical protein
MFLSTTLLEEEESRKVKLMVPSKSLLAGLALAVLGLSVSAQGVRTPKKAIGQPNRISYDLNTGQISHGQSQKALVSCWNNSDFAPWYYTGFSPAFGLESGVTYGIKACGTTTIIGSFVTAYGTSAAGAGLGGPGAALGFEFYSGGALFGVPGSLQAAFSATGLPGVTVSGANAWIVGFGLTGGLEFCLADGAFGYGIISLDTSVLYPTYGASGPLLCYAGTCPGSTTTLDANGQVDVFDTYTPPATTASYTGSWFFGGCTQPTGAPYNVSSWWLNIGEEDGTCGVASSAVRNPAGVPCGAVNAAAYAAAAPVLTTVWTATCTTLGHAANVLTFCVGFDSPTNFCIGGGTKVVLIIDGGSGELLALPPSPVVAGVASFALAVPKDLTLCGFPVFTQCVRFGGGFTLTNANDLVVGP